MVEDRTPHISKKETGNRGTYIRNKVYNWQESMVFIVYKFSRNMGDSIPGIGVSRMLITTNNSPSNCSENQAQHKVEHTNS